MAQSTFNTNRYLRPGAYIGQLIEPGTGTPPDFARIPTLVGKGSRLARVENLTITRSAVYDEALSFTPVAPHRATLAFASNQDRKTSRITDDLGNVVPESRWSFIDASTVEISPSVFNADRSYTFDYQSTDRTVKDKLPVDDMRGSARVSVVAGKDEFEEGSDFILPVTFFESDGTTQLTSPYAIEADADNTGALSVTTPTLAGTGTGSITIDGDSDYTHAYSRSYAIQCTNVAGGVITFKWASSPVSGGAGSVAHNPLAPSVLAERQEFTVAVNATEVESLEYGLLVSVDATGGAGDFVAGDIWTFTAHAAPRIEVDPRHFEDNDFLDLGTVVDSDNDPVAARIRPNYFTSTVSHTANFNVALECTASAGVSPNRTATFMFSAYGDLSAIDSGTFTVSEASAGANGWVTIEDQVGNATVGYVDLDFSFASGNFSDGDTFSFSVRQPRYNCTIRDTRGYTFKVTDAADVDGTPTVSGTYTTDTPEGSFGSFTATRTGLLNVTGSTLGLPGGLRLRACNIPADSADFTYAQDDQYYLNLAMDDEIIWTPVDRTTETIAASSLKYDPSGRVTGSAGSYYTTLRRTPSEIISVGAGTTTLASIAYSQVSGTAYIFFSALPSGSIEVTYDWRGSEPAPAQRYYFTSNYLRPASLYDVPRYIRKGEELGLLGPMSSDNDLLIGAQIALDPLNPNRSGIYVVQVRDLDDDGEFTDADYERALAATELKSNASDLVVLGRPSLLNEALGSVDRMCDPDENKNRRLWVGQTTEWPIGDAETPDTLVYLSKRTLQVFGASPAHGTRILHGARWCKRTVTLPDGSTQQVTLDGSFVSAALAGVNAAKASPGDTILHRNLTMFDELEAHNEAEARTLGAARIIFFTDLGSSVYQIGEDVTVDDFSEEFGLISTMDQQDYVRLFVNTEAAKTVGFVVPTQADRQNLVLNKVANALKLLVSRGAIAPYQTPSGRSRDLIIGSDVQAVSSTEKTRTYYRFTYFLLYPNKVVVGLFTTDGKAF